MDTIKNIGILNNRIAEISSAPLKEGSDQRGCLVVAPGFIDLHAHGRTNRNRVSLHDGLTTGLELEWE
jgi:dihydroorotase